MKRVSEWWNRQRRELETARRDNEQAREDVATKMKRAREQGAVVLLSRDALKRIASIDPTR